MRLIDADVLLEQFDRYVVLAADDVRSKIKLAPTIDAVPVVRCKDCKWCRCYDKLLLRYECTRFLSSMQVREDDFCSYGKRKDGGSND